MARAVAILFGLLVFLPFFTTAQAACVCNAYGTCSYCAETCNYCQQISVPDPAYPQVVNTLPVHFSYSHADTNTNDDVCSSSHCGTRNCNAGVTTYSNNVLPAPTSPSLACHLNPSDRAPAHLTCRYKNGRCRTYCQRVVTYTCCTSMTCTP